MGEPEKSRREVNCYQFPWCFLFRLSISHDKTVMMDAGTLVLFGWNGSRDPLRIPLDSEEAVIDHACSSHLLFSPKATEDHGDSFIQVALSPDDCLVIHQHACHCFYRQKEVPGLLSHCMQRYREIHGEGNTLPQIVMIQCSKVKHPISLCNDHTLYVTNLP